jgi:FkbM family methyltransferase
MFRLQPAVSIAFYVIVVVYFFHLLLKYPRKMAMTACTSPHVSPPETVRWHRVQAESCAEETIRNNALQLRDEHTTCPSELWYWDWISTLSTEEFVYVEIGCNKGTDALLNLRAFTGNTTVNIDAWQAATKLEGFACPIDSERWKGLKQNNTRKANRYNHHCIEAARENAAPVSEAAKKLGYHELGLLVHHAAVSSSSGPGIIKFPVVPAGAEAVGIGTDNTQFSEFNDVQVITVDEFVAENEIKQMDVLKIDTEGNDPMVIIGALRSLAYLKPRYLQFENHGVGRWATFLLKDVIDILDSLSYECFWATNSGKLIRITMCWSEEYSKIKNWSNIACHHRDDEQLSAIMRRYTWSFTGYSGPVMTSDNYTRV